ncbi:class I SAM-dependent methyltransferase [Pseudomonas typographi]|uniref:class I SAM-dependent methyltransferase n=1 Tax=Pseudomonas typographi TaxID=2715964 RepID=UPI001682F83C|nr:class I SAM-dependent methyltransferase [Pseudomonas typographi]MBD1586202.1 class I SAM-dependent methyltransferase [Pseudomonas typographi]
MKPTFTALAFAALLIPATGQAYAADASVSEAQYAQVLAGPWRAPENRARDGYRHPQQTLSFFGLAPTQTVIEITPGNGWYSEVLAPLLKDRGQYIAAVQAPGSPALAQKFAADPTRYGNVRSLLFDPKAPVFGPPASADLVLTFRNVHNWVMADTAPAMFAAFFKALKPGGVLGVVDHRGPAGESLEAIKRSGYLPTTYVIELARQAGFQLQGQSEVNANPKDSKDYPAGVWTLPPVLRLGEQDRARYLAIGESDRFTLRFVKPGGPAPSGQ